MKLTSLNDYVWKCMSDERYWTFWELQDVIKKNTGQLYGEPSISAAIRNLSKQPAPDLKESLVLKNAKGHPYATFPDTHAYIGGLRKVLGNPEDQECIDVFKANSSEIERIYNDLPANDRDLQAFEKLIDIYSKKVV